MASVDTNTALRLVKTRLNRLQCDDSLDEYFAHRVQATIQEAENIGIKLDDSMDALMYVVDYTVWSYQNRDNQAGIPDWLRLRRRELWLRSGVRQE